MVYFEGEVSLPEIMEVQPRLGIQAGQQFDIGGSRVGKMNATVIGANLRLKKGPITISYAFNYIPRKEGRFRNGGFLPPSFLSTLVLVSPNSSAANSFENGIQAYVAKDYKKALKILKPPALMGKYLRKMSFNFAFYF